MSLWRPRLGASARMKYLAIVEALEADLRAGRVRPGDRLPPQRAIVGIGVVPAAPLWREGGVRPAEWARQHGGEGWRLAGKPNAPGRRRQGLAQAPTVSAFASANAFAARNRSASSAAMQPVPAAVTAWR